jgi:hypothetical protein
VPGHRWADLSEQGFGVSLLSDARYGYSTFGNVMSLSLLRGTMSPDAHADVGVHRLRYALYPHQGDWRVADTVRHATCFNRPLLWIDGNADAFLSKPLVASEPSNVIIDTIKPAEDGKGFVVRLYESSGCAANVRLTFGVRVRDVQLSNTLEDKLQAIAVKDNACMLALRPFQIATLRIAPRPVVTYQGDRSGNADERTRGKSASLSRLTTAGFPNSPSGASSRRARIRSSSGDGRAAFDLASYAFLEARRLTAPMRACGQAQILTKHGLFGRRQDLSGARLRCFDRFLHRCRLWLDRGRSP